VLRCPPQDIKKEGKKRKTEDSDKVEEPCAYRRRNLQKKRKRTKKTNPVPDATVERKTLP